MSVTPPKYGSPADRGSADAYYGRPYNPHYWPYGTGKGICVNMDEMTAGQIAEYREAYDNEPDRKDWR